MSRGSNAEEDAVGVNKDMKEFVEACLHAGSNSALFLIQEIMKGAKDNPIVALQALPMLHSEYSPNRTKVTHEVEGHVDVIHKKMNLEHATYEELEALETIAERLESGDIVDAEIVDEEG